MNRRAGAAAAVMAWALVVVGLIAGWPATGFFWGCLAYAVGFTALAAWAIISPQ